MKDQALHPSLQLDGPGAEDRTVTLWHWQTPKPLGQGGGDKTASGIRSGLQNYKGCYAFQCTGERQKEEHSLENTHTAAAGKGHPSSSAPARPNPVSQDGSEKGDLSEAYM